MTSRILYSQSFIIYAHNISFISRKSYSHHTCSIIDSCNHHKMNYPCSQVKIFICKNVWKWWHAIGAFNICYCACDSNVTQIRALEWWIYDLSRIFDYHHLWCDECTISSWSPCKSTQSSHPKWWRNTQWIYGSYSSWGACWRYYWVSYSSSSSGRIIHIIFFLSLRLFHVFYPRRRKNHISPWEQWAQKIPLFSDRECNI